MSYFNTPIKNAKSKILAASIIREDTKKQKLIFIAGEAEIVH